MPDNTTLSTILMVVLMVGGFWLLIIRPNQKKQKQHQEMVNQLADGSRVLLGGGVFGSVVHSGVKQVIVEISPGVEIAVAKQAIIRLVEPSEEEFEFEDEEELSADESAADAPGVLGAWPQEQSDDDRKTN